MRVDGYADIRDYAVIGDGRTAALVAGDGCIDWLCLPNFDSPSVFASVLDIERGGSFVLQPAIPFGWSRQYLPDTNVLQTTFTTDRGTVRITDAMTLPDEHLEPMREVVRVVEGLAGVVPMRWRVVPRFQYGSGAPRREMRGNVPTATFGSDAVAVCSWDAGMPAWEGPGLRGSFDTIEGKRALIALVSAHGEPLVLPGRHAVESRLDGTVRFWRRWAGERTYDGPWRESVLRSALVLKLLFFAPSGAALAAGTTSLPEQIGGVRNWDYRFCWIRDSNFHIEAMLRLGGHDEARALFWWFMQATALTEPRLQVLYRLDGGPRADERELSLSGYRASRPVRVGNAAIDQLQLDIYGALLEAAWLFGQTDHLDHDTGRVLGRIADLVCDIWRQPDSSIWEVRSAPRQFTHSKVMCWVALDRAIRLARLGKVPGRHLMRWSTEQAAIQRFIETECWSARRRSYARAAGSDEMDASLLMMPLVGYGDPAGERMKGTIDAVCKDLRHGPFVFRYLGEDGLPGEEGCFLNCSFWLAGALARAGRTSEATDLMDKLVARANDVGLFAEEIAPMDGAFLGNFPQALVHLSLIDAALVIAADGDSRLRA